MDNQQNQTDEDNLKYSFQTQSGQLEKEVSQQTPGSSYPYTEQSGPIGVNEPETIPPAQSMVVPVQEGGIPKWFYFLFIVVLVAFLAVSGLLVRTIIQNQQAGIPLNLTPTPTSFSPATAEPTFEISPVTTQVLPATDSAVLKLKELRNSDEIDDLEFDLDMTELIVLDEGLSLLDSQFGVSP